MPDIKDQYQQARLKAIQELEKQGVDAYIPANVWGFDLSALDGAGFAPDTRYGYRRELIAIMNSGINPGDIDALKEYAAGLKPYRKRLLRRALQFMATVMKKADSPAENLPVVQELTKALKIRQVAGEGRIVNPKSPHIWLSPSQVKEITSLCGKDLEGKRDWIVLALFLGAGLQRAEVAAITFDALQQRLAKNGKKQDVLQVSSETGKNRIVPISSLLARRLREWKKIAGAGYIARSFNNKKLGERLSSTSLYQIVHKYGMMIKVADLKIDDLRRTYARLAYFSGITPIHIKEMMGHESLRTTESYLNLVVDLDDITGEFVPLME